MDPGPNVRFPLNPHPLPILRPTPMPATAAPRIAPLLLLALVAAGAWWLWKRRSAEE
jgi:hypothetical protein